MAFSTRRARPEDHAAISKLVAAGGTTRYRKQFGAFNLAALLETGFLPLVVVKEDTTPAAGVRCFVVFSDGPRNETHKAEEKLLELKELGDLAVGNTLWVDFCAAESGAGRDLFEHALRTALTTLPAIDHVLLLTTESVPPECAAFFKAVEEKRVAYRARESIVPTLKVRDAKVEDSDDLLPIFEEQSQNLSQHFGEFFIAEMIEAQDEQNRAIVATRDGRAVGMLTASADLDVPTLQQCFELDVYDGFEKSNVRLPNAFAITLFCLDREHESRASDFLAPMFALYPERDYCIFTAPPSVRSDSHLLRNFTPVPPRFGSTFTHALYVLHRRALLAPRVSRFDRATHLQGVSRLVPERVSEVLDRCDAEAATSLSDNPNEAAFAAVVGDRVVGFVALGRRAASTNAVSWLKANYQVEDYVPFERHRARAQAVLTYCVVDPIFAVHARFVLKEAMRLYDKTVVYHETTTTDVSTPPSPVVLAELAPIRARWRPTPGPTEQRDPRARNFDDDDFDDDVKPECVSSPPNKKKEEVGGRLLHHITRRLVVAPKLRVTARIVVSGATTCAIGFLETLLFQGDLHFVHVTVLSPDGFLQRNQRRPLQPVDEDAPEQFVFDALGLSHRVRAIHSAIKNIDRENRAVVLGDGTLVPYDLLVLADGVEESTKKRLLRQDAPADILASSLARVEAMTRAAFSGVADDDDVGAASPEDSRVSPENKEDVARALRGLVSLSSQKDVDAFIADDVVFSRRRRRLKHEGITIEPPVVLVYGGTLRALAAVHGLSTFPVVAKLVIPSDDLDSLGDAVIDRLVKEQLEAGGATVLFGRSLKSLVHDDDGTLVGARFSSRDEEIIIECDVVLGADAADTSIELFRAINEAGLVYDGRLVVDSTFRTTDPAIYAAGPHTKFSKVEKGLAKKHGGGPRALYHERNNELELGTRLAGRVLAALLDEDDDHTFPTFCKPHTVSAVLPGGLFYCRSSLPLVPNDCELLPTGSLDDPTLKRRDGDDAVPNNNDVDAARTGVRSHGDVARARGRYTVLKVDGGGRVSEILYLGRDPVEPRNLAALVGLQEAWLNSAWASYDRGIVDDWIEFFRQDWCSSLRFDRFADLQTQIRDILVHDAAAGEIVETLRKEFKAGKDPATLRLLRSELLGVAGSALPPQTKDLLENAVLGYLRKNRVLLPRFHLPDRRSRPPVVAGASAAATLT
ncbi:hypothetical protein CTAYLR_009707 [Chrysophaeum taylorii]|uniref:Cilia- and flagella-associated protein 61 N-terminal domain-containing protein n=1 Tax=Chrysophaeum taylorii TaxID=2483200 RepID=A0AAD7UFC5_9STRA|nr:hypothetical protein CTAYLR_009707 [Chrysophaeum taylorii]